MRGLISKGLKYLKPKQICPEEVRKEIQNGIDQFIERISNDKGIHKNHVLEWKSHIISSGNQKIRSLKIKCRSVKSIFSAHEVKNTIFSVKTM